MNKYYSLENILKYKATYNVIFGERSNGKTYAVLKYALNKYWTDDSQLAIVRRWEEDFQGKNGSQMFDGLVNNHEIDTITDGEYNSIYYWSSRWYLCYYDAEGKRVKVDEKPLAYAFAITSEEHYKSTSYPNIRTILFDEFLTRKFYLPDEFVKFTSIVSTIVRLRDDVTIFMCGNTVNKYCPYFTEMGLSHIKNQEQGTIDLYSYGDSGLTVAVEYSDFSNQEKKSNKYFAFNNPKLKMITSGAWEIALYPHLPSKYNKKDILYNYYIVFDGEMLEAEIIYVINYPGDLLFTYIHRKTTPIRADNEQMVYQKDYDPRPNYRRKILKPMSKIEQKIAEFYKIDKVFYQDNEVGEIMRNYLIWCTKEEI